MNQIQTILPPIWYSHELYHEAIKKYKKVSMVIQLNLLFGLNFLLWFSEMETILADSPMHQSINTCSWRYFSTLKHVNIWFTYDPYKENSKTQKSIRLMKKYHKNQKANQKNLKLTQFAFFGLPLLFPKELGFNLFNKSDFDAFCHVFAIICHEIGLKEKNNLFLPIMEFDSTYNYSSYLMKKIKIENYFENLETFKFPKEILLDMGSLHFRVLTGLQPLTLFYPKTILHYSIPLLVDSSIKLPKLSFLESLNLYFLKFLLLFVSTKPFLLEIFSKLSTISVNLLVKKLPKITLPSNYEIFN